MKILNLISFLIGLLVLLGCGNQSKEKKQTEHKSKTDVTSYQMPPNNPFLIQNSMYPSVHFNTAQSDATSLNSWDKDITLTEKNIKWLPWVTSIGAAHRPYKNGEEALFVAGTNKVGKIKISNGEFAWVDELTIPDLKYKTASAEKIRQRVEAMIAAGLDEEKYLPIYEEHLKENKQSSATLGNGVYTVMDKDGNYFAGFGTSMYKVSDEVPGDINSGIKLSSSYNLKDGLPPEEAEKISRIFAVGMTYDGFIAVAMPGIIAVLDRNLENMQYILLEGEAVDNGISIDDKGGIYVVTSK